MVKPLYLACEYALEQRVTTGSRKAH
jgi:hypothetical protein